MKTSGKERDFFSLFVRLNIIYSLFFVLNPQLVSAAPGDSDFYYYSSGRKIPLPLSREMLAMRFKPEVSFEQREQMVQFESNLSPFAARTELSVFDLTLLPLREGITQQNVIQAINALNTRSEVQFAGVVADVRKKPLFFVIFSALNLDRFCYNRV